MPMDLSVDTARRNRSEDDDLNKSNQLNEVPRGSRFNDGPDVSR